MTGAAQAWRRRVALAVAAMLAGMLAACHGGDDAGGAAAASSAPVVVAAAPQGPVRHVLAIGDSLFAGYGLRAEQAYPVRLGAALRAQGMAVEVVNASVSGDTTADGAARLGFSLDAQGAKPDLVLICLGGNDMLRGLPPAATRANLEAMMAELDRRHIPVVLMGMLAAPNLGPDYARAFDAIWPGLARAHHAVLVPFFLSAVIDRADLRQADHIHPTAAGVEAIVTATEGAVAGRLRAK